jgi:hypothetical protein
MKKKQMEIQLHINNIDEEIKRLQHLKEEKKVELEKIKSDNNELIISLKNRESKHLTKIVYRLINKTKYVKTFVVSNFLFTLSYYQNSPHYNITIEKIEYKNNIKPYRSSGIIQITTQRQNKKQREFFKWVENLINNTFGKTTNTIMYIQLKRYEYITEYLQLLKLLIEEKGKNYNN